MELAANQQGLLSVAQAHEAGLDGRALRRLVERGLLTRERRGIYLVTGVRRRPLHAAIEAVVLAGGVLSHRSAAELHGIGTQLSGRTEVTVVRPRHPRSQPGVIIRQTRRLDRTELTIIGGLEVTAPPRTMLDLAASAYGMKDDKLNAMLAEALASRKTTLGSIEKYLASQPKGVDGIQRLRAAIAEAVGAPTDSAAERELLDLLLSAGIPRPRTQYIIRNEHGEFVAKVDNAWPGETVVLELDSYRYHGDPRSFAADRARHNLIVMAGWTVLYTNPAQLRRHPEEVVHSVRVALLEGGLATRE